MSTGLTKYLKYDMINIVNLVDVLEVKECLNKVTTLCIQTMEHVS
jgi:hypothetical protein